MPISCKCILDHLKHKGAITEKEYDKLLRNLKGTEWIPVTERLPKEGEEVLATHLGGINPNRQVIEHVYENGRFVNGWYMDTNDFSPTFGQRYMGDIIAWMPKPEPYYEEEGEEELNSKDTNNKNDVIVVQIDCLMPMGKVMAFRKELLAQMKEGIIVIPPWAHVAHVGDECKIEIKEMEEERSEETN